ncbi:hypothetical protein FCV25MIE_21040 [Fagus crenata]
MHGMAGEESGENNVRNEALEINQNQRVRLIIPPSNKTSFKIRYSCPPANCRKQPAVKLLKSNVRSVQSTAGYPYPLSASCYCYCY